MQITGDFIASHVNSTRQLAISAVCTQAVRREHQRRAKESRSKREASLTRKTTPELSSDESRAPGRLYACIQMLHVLHVH